MQSTTSTKIITILRGVLARNGSPEKCWSVSDNGPQFTSEEFDKFTRTKAITHLKSAPYHPATNQSGETCVQTFKQSLRAMKWDASSVERTL